MKLKITLLGTGTSQGVPVIACSCKVCLSGNTLDKRLRSSVLIENGENTVVIDSGPDFRQQMLRYNIRVLDAVVFTHGHKDHVAGLDDVRAYNYIQKKPMDIYAEENVLSVIKREYPYVFAENKYPGVPELSMHKIINESFFVESMQITPIRAFHHLLPVFGYRIEDFAYITDVNRVPDEELIKFSGLKCLVVNGLRKEKHVSHFNLEEALEFIGTVKPQKAYISHISHLMGLHAEVEKELPPNVHLAFDGLSLEI